MDDAKLLAAIAVMNDNVIGLRTEVTGLGTEVTGLRTEVTGLGTEVTGLRTEVTGLRTEVTGLGTEVTGLRAEVAGLRTEVTGLQNRVTNLETEMTGFRVAVMDRFERIEDKLTTLSDDVRVNSAAIKHVWERHDSKDEEVRSLAEIVRTMHTRILRLQTDVDHLKKAS